jgi:hypothetical protein
MRYLTIFASDRSVLLTSVNKPQTTIVSLLIGGVFIAAGFSKAYSSTELVQVFLYDGFPRSMVRFLSIGVILVELTLGLSLIFQVAMFWSLRIATMLLILFSLQIIILLFAREAPNCGCFGLVELIKSKRLVFVVSLIRNLLILGGLWWLRYWYERERSSPLA